MSVTDQHREECESAASRLPDPLEYVHAPPVLGHAVPVLSGEFVRGWLPRLGPTSTLTWWTLAQAPGPEGSITYDALAGRLGVSPGMARKAVIRLLRLSPVSWVSSPDGVRLRVPLSSPPAPLRAARKDQTS